MLEVGRAKQHVPPGQQHAKVAPAQGHAARARPAGAKRFMAHADGMVQPVKTRADPQALAPVAKPQAQVGMVQVFAGLRQRDDGYELPRRHAYALRHADDDGVAQQVVQQVIGLATSLHWVIWRCGMVQGMQAPPPVEMVLATMYPVIQQIENQQTTAAG